MFSPDISLVLLVQVSGAEAAAPPSGQGAPAQQQLPPRDRSYLGAYSAAAMYAAAARDDDCPALGQQRSPGLPGAAAMGGGRAATAAEDGGHEEENWFEAGGGREREAEAVWQPSGLDRQQWENGAARRGHLRDDGAHCEMISGGGYEGHDSGGQHPNRCNSPMEKAISTSFHLLQEQVS